MNNLLAALSSGAVTGIIIGGIAAFILLMVFIFIVWYIKTGNAIIRLKNNVEEGWSTIDVYLKKRYDLIPNLVETVKGYAGHESGTLDAVIRARSGAMSAQGIDQKIAAENQLTGTLKSLFALSEAYPQLKADSQFLNLQNQLMRLEDEISKARKYYNGTAKVYNNKIMTFPSSFVARRKGFTKQAYFEAAESERENVKVSF